MFKWVFLILYNYDNVQLSFLILYKYDNVQMSFPYSLQLWQCSNEFSLFFITMTMFKWVFLILYNYDNVQMSFPYSL